MRIALYSDNFYPELSGISDTIITTGKTLRARGHEVAYVGPYYAPHDYAIANRQYPDTPEHDTIDGMPIVRLRSLKMPLSPTGQSRFAFANGGSLPFMRTFKPDVIHTQSPYGVGLEAAKAARTLGVPLVGTNHTAVEDFFPPGTHFAIRRWDAHYYNRCSFVTAPYQGLIDRMRQAGFTRAGRAVSNPADLHEFYPPSAEQKAEHKRALGIEGPVVLYTGRLGVEKRVDVLVRAMEVLHRHMPQVTFLATGHGAAQAGLERLVQRLGLGRHVRFTGYLPRAALPHIYQAADLFWMASTSDSQSMALMQAYATGLPAVNARARGLPDYTPQSCGFLATPGKPDEFARYASELLQNEQLRQEMGKAAIEFAARLSPDSIAAEWEHIYTQALEQKSKTAGQ